MAEHRRIANGLLSDTSQQETWNGSAWVASAGLPLAGDTLHANGFNTVLDVNLLDVDIKNNVNFNGTTVSGRFEILSAGITYRGTRYATTVPGSRPVLFVSFGGGTSYVLGGAEIVVQRNFNAFAVGDCGLLINGQSGGRLVLETTGNADGTGTGRSVDASGAGNGFIIEVADILGCTGITSGTRCRAGLAVLGDGYKVIAMNITPANDSLGGALVVNGNGNEIDVDGIAIGCGTNNSRSVAISYTDGNTVRVNGIAVATQFSPAIIQQMTVFASWPDYGSSTIELNGVAIDSGNYSAIVGTAIKAPDAPSDASWAMKTPTGGDRTLYTAGLLTGYPLEAKVEDGTVYGPSSEFEGTLEPVNIDTAQLAADLLNELSTSPNALAERLRNVSTIQTTGAQIAALNIAP